MSQTNWYKALEWGSRLHEEEKNRLEAPLQYRSMLGIPPDAPLTRNYLVKVFRKLSLQSHPDKGGDHEKFTAIRHAYTSLLALHNEEYEKKNSIEIEYEAVIERAQGAGLGIVVLEDPVRRRIVVQTVLKNIILKGLSEESEGEIRPGDCLTTIENDHCQHWPLSRVRERLNSYRVPAGSIVRLTLSRRILQQKSSDSPPTSPTESERGARDQYPLTAPPSLLDPGNDEQPPPPDDPLLTPSPLRNNRSWISDEESPFSPAERTPKSSPRPKKNVAMSPPQSPELQYPPKMQINFGARSTKISHTSQQTEEVPKSSYVEEKSPFLSRNSDSELNESYETDDSGDSKTIPRTSIGPHERVLLPEENHRFKQLKQTLITSPESMQNNPTIENQLTSQSIEQILNEISFTSLPNLINHDSHREDQNLFKQWEQELSRLEDDDEAEESNHGIFLSKINSNQTLDYEAELLKTKSDLFSSHTIRTQMASHIDLLTNEINELKERSLALVSEIFSYFHSLFFSFSSISDHFSSLKVS